MLHDYTDLLKIIALSLMLEKQQCYELGLKRRCGGRRLQLFNTQMQILDREDTSAQNFNFNLKVDAVADF